MPSSVSAAATFDASAAVRYSDYSTFGGATTGKAGFRWQPISDLALRGTYSKGFRAPNLGELYGLTQFGATLVDPCSDAVVGNTRSRRPAARRASRSDSNRPTRKLRPLPVAIRT